MTKLPSFPFRVEKKNCRVTIYHNESDGYDQFKVVYYHEGQRKAQTFGDFEKAKGRANEITDLVNSGELEMLSLSRSQGQEYRQAVDALTGTGVGLVSAAIQFLEAKKILGNGSLLEAAQFYASRHRGIIQKPIKEIREDYMASQISHGTSPKRLQQLSSTLTRFERTFQCALGSISAAELAGFLAAPPKISEQCPAQRGGVKVASYSPVTFNSIRQRLSHFFKYARRMHYLPSDWAELDKIERRKLEGDEIEIYTPGEIARFLDACSSTEVSGEWAPVRRQEVPERRGPSRSEISHLRWATHNRQVARDLRIYISIGAFAGIRSAELLQLRWENVGVGAGSRYIQIRAKHAKTRARRLVPISENLKAWLAPYQKKEGPIFERGNDWIYHPIEPLSKSIGIPWKPNALRHSYISYRVAQTSDVAKVSLEAGSSPRIIFQHYRELVTPEAAAEWFAIKPADASDKIICLKTATA